MLSITKSTTFTGTSSFGGIAAQGYQAVIKHDNPEDISLSNWINNYEVYKAHRSECGAERAQFEDEAFKLQDHLTAERQKAEAEEQKRTTAPETEQEAKSEAEA